MPLKSFRPTSAGRRHAVLLDYAELSSKAPEKSLVQHIPKGTGRNNQGRMTARHRGGGHRRVYRLIDFKRDKDGVPGKVVALEYDPNRSANLALVQYADGEKRYILAPAELGVGQTIMSGASAEPLPGNCLPLANIPDGVTIHNLEMQPGRGGQVCRSAGSAAQLTAREGAHAIVRMPSGEIRKLHVSCRATVGRVGNIDWQNVHLGKAGRTRYLGRRPHVRGTCKNPVDHPLGGGEGRTKGGRHPCSPTGVLAKGGKTRRPTHPTNKFILRRRKV
jgi:large subunit ribosomal protein L2